jgi:threonine/homoserine/homoserine lactone efflux protein
MSMFCIVLFLFLLLSLFLLSLSSSHPTLLYLVFGLMFLFWSIPKLFLICLKGSYFKRYARTVPLSYFSADEAK